MALKTSLTGSYPPIYDPEYTIRNKSPEEQNRIVRESIDRAVDDQIAAGIDVLVDGQPRDDVISLFARHLPGFAGDSLLYHITGPVRPAEAPVTMDDYCYARDRASLLAEGKPVKAHITGPVTLARSALVSPDSGYQSGNDPKLVHDLAIALAHEAQLLVQAGAQIVQIDEPFLQGGMDIALATAAINQIVEAAEIPFPGLHTCGNIVPVLHDILKFSAVKMVSIEGAWLNRQTLSDINETYLTQVGKQIGLGCIRADRHDVERPNMIRNLVDHMALRLGENNIWAIMPNCGLRALPYEVAREKMRVMCQAIHSLYTE